jgi:DNA (cytosine-5)-methyltransferase 1
MDTLGYPLDHAAVLSVNSAHIGGDGIPYAPQWRDRLYLAFVRKDIGRRFDLTPAPRSLCFECGDVVAGVQYWCPAAQGRALKVGRYRRKANSSYGQYWYVCPRGCQRRGRPARVEPFILPAIAAIDWTDLGEPIADGQLVRNSLQRIAVG